MKNKYLDEVLFDRKTIQKAIKESAKWANNTFKSSRTPIVLIGILNGCIPYYGQLLTQLKFSVITDFVRVDSYLGAEKKEQEPQLTLNVTEKTKKDIKNKTVVVVDDIFGAGKSAKLVYEEMMKMGAKDVVFMFLFDQQKEKLPNIPFKYHAALNAPDLFLIGYGLDYQNRYRNLDCVGKMKDKYIKK